LLEAFFVEGIKIKIIISFVAEFYYSDKASLRRSVRRLGLRFI
jgi:hypothetical protein